MFLHVCFTKLQPACVWSIMPSFSLLLPLFLAPSLCWFMTFLINVLINGCAGKALGLFCYFFAWIPAFSYVCLQWLLPYNELMLAPIGVKYCSSADHSAASALNSFVVITPRCGHCVTGCTKKSLMSRSEFPDLCTCSSVSFFYVYGAACVDVETYLPWRQSSTGEEWIMDQGKMGASAERCDLRAIQRKGAEEKEVCVAS